MRRSRIVTALLLTTSMLVGSALVGNAASADYGWNCTYDMDVYSSHGGFVSAETEYSGGQYGMLRATDNVLNNFDRCEWYDSATYSWVWAFRSRANGLWVSAEVGYTGTSNGMLRARADVIGPWEKFRRESVSGGYWALKAVGNGKYVSAELGYGGDTNGMLRARADVIGPWEQFYFWS